MQTGFGACPGGIYKTELKKDFPNLDSPQKLTGFAGQFRFIIIIFILTAALMLASAFIELQQSKKELYQLMAEQAHSLLESLITASQNTLRATTYLDDLSEQRLLNNASMVKQLYEGGQISDAQLFDLSKKNNLQRIHIIDRKGHRRYSSHTPTPAEEHALENRLQTLSPIFEGLADTLFLGYRRSPDGQGHSFALALAARDRSAIVLNTDAQDMLAFKRDIDFGALIRKVVQDNPRVIYIALQDNEHILAASGNVADLDEIGRSGFLYQALRDSSFATRTVAFPDGSVFEVVQPFAFFGETIGLFRLGLSLAPVQDINERIVRRLIIISLVLIVIGFILFVYIFTRQRLSILQKQYEVVETYSGNIIENVSDAIIVLDNKRGVKIFNQAAGRLFNQPRARVEGRHLSDLFPAEECRLILSEDSLLKQLTCTIGDQQKYLLVSRSRFVDSDGNDNTILVIRDLTEQRQMEARLERQQRLTAMGELASGVAHEIRNPLNTIGTIVQQLDKDFEPRTERDEYHQLAGLVYSEVKRINETVQDFLRFARPEPIQPALFSLDKFLNQLQKQYAAVLREKNIELSIDSSWHDEVYWDENQIRQVFINILQNAMEAIGENGRIGIEVQSEGSGHLVMRIADNGPGMSEQIRSNIFNLYFTTKARGTGIGLSIVQRIIYEHGGLITVQSGQSRGSVFMIKLPVRALENM